MVSLLRVIEMTVNPKFKLVNVKPASCHVLHPVLLGRSEQSGHGVIFVWRRKIVLGEISCLQTEHSDIFTTIYYEHGRCVCQDMYSADTMG